MTAVLVKAIIIVVAIVIGMAVAGSRAGKAAADELKETWKDR